MVGKTSQTCTVLKNSIRQLDTHHKGSFTNHILHITCINRLDCRRSYGYQKHIGAFGNDTFPVNSPLILVYQELDSMRPGKFQLSMKSFLNLPIVLFILLRQNSMSNKEIQHKHRTIRLEFTFAHSLLHLFHRP